MSKTVNHVSDMKLSVVIPALNEERNIGPTLDALHKRLWDEGVAYEIVVTDDGSTDGTIDEIDIRIRTGYPVRVVCNEGPHGFGYAVRCGLDHVTGDAVAIVMADGSDSPDDLIRYFYILRDRAECAFGSRFLPASRLEKYPWPKLVVNRLANRFIQLLFNLDYNDVTNAFKAYRMNVIHGCRPLLSPHFNLTVELPLKAMARGYTYEVIPIGWRQRVHGVSRLKLKEMGSRYLFIVLYVWLEKLLTGGDYRRPRNERFEAWPSRGKSTLMRDHSSHAS